MTKEVEKPKEEHPVHKFSDLSDSGVLWAINRIVFHPRGFALALERDDQGAVIGWNIYGDGEEVWRFDSVDEDAFMHAFERALARALPYRTFKSDGE